jgi:6-phosphofructokinase 1
MNAAIRATTLIGRAAGCEVYGVERGYKGLVEGAFVPLGAADVQGILRDGGTILGSARCKEFHERAVRDRARSQLSERKIDGLVVIGGNGSLTGAMALGDPEEAAGRMAPRVVGIPASIDNDIGLTGLAIGVDTAMNTIVEAVDKIADTATAHDRTFIVEVMGRDCGYLSMTSAIACGADLALFPEAHRSEDQVVDAIIDAVAKVRSRSRRNRRVIVIKAEGVHVGVDRLKERVDARLRERLGGDDMSSIETRVTVLGHVVRGGRPSAFDRLLGSRLANVATRALIGGKTHKMAAWMPPVELPEEVGARSTADPYCWLVDLAAALVETDSLLHGKSQLARWRAGVFDDIEDALLL